MWEKISITNATLISLILFSIVVVIYPGLGVNEASSNILTIASFFFGIFVAFSIATNHSKLQKVNESLNSDEGILLFIYKSSIIFGEKVQNDILSLLDNYLMSQLDYFLYDFRYSSKEFIQLVDYIFDLKPGNSKQEAIYGAMVDAISTSMQNRKNAESLVSERMARFEWLAIILLLIINLLHLFLINNGSVVMSISVILVSLASILLVFVLRDLDILRWKESTWIWDPLENLFKELGLLPYYPKDVIDSGRIQVEKGERVRLATYPNKYPDMSGKEVTEVTI